MPESLDPYIAWLDYDSNERAPGYYALLGLALCEPDVHRIQQAILDRSTIVSNHLHGPQRAVAERVLAELSYAEGRLTDPTSKAAYDVLLRKSLGDSRRASTHADDAPVMLVEVESRQAQPDEPGLPEPIAVPPPAPAVLAKDEQPLKPPPARYRPTTTFAADAAIQAESRSLLQKRATQAAPAPQPRLSDLIGNLTRRVARHRKRLAAGLVVVLALWAVLHSVGPSRRTRPPRGPYIMLEPAEEMAVGEQFGILYDPGQPADVRTAAVEKLRSLSHDAIRKYGGRLKDVATKQPEAEIQQSLQDVLNNAGVQ